MINVIKFETHYRQGKEPVDMVLVSPRGEAMAKVQTWQRVKSLIPDPDADPVKKDGMSYQDMAAKWDVIGPKYAAWKNGQEIPEEGTPLAVWPGVTPEQARALVGIGIKTVEAVRDMGENDVQALRFPNARKFPELAAKFLEGQGAAEKDAEISQLKEQMAAMEELLQERIAQEEKPIAKEEKPRRATKA